MRAIYKYDAPLTSQPFTIELPKGAEVLAFDEQGGRIYFWAMVDPAAETETRTLHIAGTGHPLPDEKMRYIGTCQQAGGALIWHLFELERTP